ncbi:SIS domain-containing protein (plasmid) [Streptomyces sp. BI20]|uniref:SIS domain-containing protein n=1 Tax=Streptomyces sp. BI20 TaxID=3403460 RepID=UPI003C7455FF
MSFTITETASQPSCWRRALDLVVTGLPERGERVAVIGCGTSRHMAHAYAVLRESRGHGETDVFAAAELPLHRRYDRVLAITRSGTTTEVLDALAALRDTPRTVLTAVPDGPAAAVAEHLVVLDFADERSIVQTRFATTALMLLRAHLGASSEHLAAQAELALAEELPPAATTAEQITFLGTGWAAALADEAALKVREAAGLWTESYSAKEYRHGPVSVTGPGRVVWFLDTPPPGLCERIAATGGTAILPTLDPMAELVRVHRLAVERAERAGLDPDKPRHLTRSVVLTGAEA